MDRPTRPDVMTHRWARLRATVPGAEKVRLHDLRHHAATQFVTEGVDVREVMRRLGWTTLATAQRYIHAVDEADAAAADAMERALGG
jgi:integrase